MQLAAVSNFHKSITQLYESITFKDNFVPFILETNMSKNEDPIFCNFLSKCIVGWYDFEYIIQRICGEGHAYTKECENMFDSVTICSLHKNRKELLSATLGTFFPNQVKYEIQAIDTHENGAIVSDYITKKIQTHLVRSKKH